MDKFTRFISSSNEEKPGWRAREGQVLVMFAAGLMLLIGIVAVAVDTGFLMAERRQVQNAADAGALAAAKAKLDYLYESNLEGAQQEAGKRYASDNAATAQDNVEVDTDPAMDEFGDVYIEDINVNRYVEVTVSKDVDMFFLRALYDGDWGTSATAIAGIEPVPRTYALLALGCGTGSKGGIDVSGSGKVDVQLGSIMSNCEITSSGAASGSEVIAAVAIDAFGKIEAGSGWCGGEDCTEINENQPQVGDPVVEEGIEPPSEEAARAVREVVDEESMRDAVTNLGSQTNLYRCPQGSTCVMQPGYYGGSVSGISVRGTLQMEPGIYYFDDNFVIDGHSENTIIRGDDVLLYFTGNSAFQPKHATIELSAAGQVGSGGCEAALDAMVVWIENGSPFHMQSNGTFKIDGVFYAPDSNVRLFGGTHSNSMQVIVEALELSGGNDFNIEFLDCFDGSTQHVFLVQ